MAHGGTARWVVGLSAVGATALLATAGIVGSDLMPSFAPAAAGTAASSSSSSAAGAAGSTATPAPTGAPAAGSTEGTTSASGTSSTATSSGSGTASGSESGGTTSDLPSTASGTPGETAPGTDADVPSVAFIGDSWTDGAGASGNRGYAYLTGDQLGWENLVLGVGGSGYVVGGHGDVPFDERIDPALADNPDVVVIQGTINERNTPVEDLAPAVADTLSRLRTAAGTDTAVIVLGASYVPGLEQAVVDRVNDTVRATAAELGLRYIDVVAENWTDAADPGIWADPYHPNDRGYQIIADRLAPILRAAVSG